jgi:hypothetical protein
VLSGVINGSLSISVCARISDRLAAGRVITLASRQGHRTFPVAPAAAAGRYGVAWRSAAHAIDTIADVEMQAFETVDQAAIDAIAILEEGEQLSALWRYDSGSGCPPVT